MKAFHQSLIAIHALLASASMLLAQGVLAPPGAPAPTMKSLSQVEPRTPLAGGSSSVTISQPGSYYLTGNLTMANGDAIVIAASQVTLDLSGFTISSNSATASGSGIVLGSTVRDTHILNGHIQSGVTYSGSFSTGPGFSYGISSVVGSQTPKNIHISGISVSGVRFSGIEIVYGGSSIVDHCYLDIVGGVGIRADTVTDCVVNTCGLEGILAASVVNSSGVSVATSTGIAGTTVINSVGKSASGNGISASSATNCNGSSTSGAGISASTATGCSGASTDGPGVSAGAAENCDGSSYSSQGVTAFSVNNCSGSSWTSQGIAGRIATGCSGDSTQNRGISVETAISCYGISHGGSYGINARSLAINSYGYSDTGTGLAAYIVNSCRGENSGGASVGYSFKYNMP
jgi:hypothetical protein